MPVSVKSAVRPVFIVDAARTPIGKFSGGLSTIRTDDLAAHVIQGLAARNPVAIERVDQVIFGATNQAGEDNRNVARMASLLAGLPFEVPGMTVNRLCGSGLEAVGAAYRMIALGEAECAVAGGVESMTRAPYVMSKSPRAFHRSAPEVYDSSIGWRFPNPKMAERFPLLGMGETAENVATKHSLTREDQDAYALRSHQRAQKATEAGEFRDELLPVTVPQRKGDPLIVDRDESVRGDTSMEKLARLRAIFREGGSVTAGNSSPINDGAAGLLLMTGAMVEQLGLEPMARIVGNATVGLDPSYMGEGPILAVRKLLKQCDLRAPNIDWIELNEAFASQSLACLRTLELDPDKVNVKGGALALGHPIGCSGARILVTLAHTMKQRGGSLGLASLCIGVGQGIATLIERP